MNARAKGFTLVELLVVVLIGSIVLGAVYQTLSSQERVNRQQIAVISTEQNTRMALEILQNDLRELSAADGDIYSADSVSIRYRQMRKAGVICTKDFVNNSWLNVAVVGNSFAANDSVLVYQDGNNTMASNDDSWAAFKISSTGAGVCAGNVLGNIMRINFPNGTTAQADTGGLVRSFVPVGYRLVNGSSNGTTVGFLYRMESPDSVAIVDNLAKKELGGLRLRYFDINGNAVLPTTSALRQSIMRIQIKVTGTYAGGQTGSNRMFADSLVGTVFLRGNKKSS